MSDPKIAVVYYSSTGTVHALANAVVEGAEKAGAQVRLRRVPELASDDVVRSVPEWAEHLEATKDVPFATHDDLEWADGFLFGTPTRFGNVAAQLRQFLDTLSPLWQEGTLADKPASGFTAAHNTHGGQETTLVSLYQTFMHWGSFIVPPGYTDESVFGAGGNPYGVSASVEDGALGDAVLDAARHQGRRVAETAQTLLAGRSRTAA
ncbi:NAD(P)H dehydrogenase (quinone) [Haloactinopolyspora alba]|uniref:NAD(P)H dehydrogenase (Quinone) n=1 Tax=Haloactinopolyspora alba TaxID=648780 RepID=A0A2P8E586_9ACTN|nr:NAD(P)H:quinone oxidoreductase [Haloactinopolyspora alba]PSL04644.1 NAD(P)H dehydrogenase (quinone) [Haloactinopolyspora alba]